MIFVSGGTRKQRTFAEDIACFCYMQLMPLIRKCRIEINIKNMEGYEGTCIDTDEREYAIDVNKNQSFEDFCVTICHEMVHVKQYVYKELFSEVNFYNSREEYLNLPWEVEAYEKQEILFKKWKKDTKLNLTKKQIF